MRVAVWVAAAFAGLAVAVCGTPRAAAGRRLPLLRGGPPRKGDGGPAGALGRCVPLARRYLSGAFRGRSGPAVGDVARLAATVAAVVQAGLPPDHAWGAIARTGGPCAAVCAAVTRAVEAGVPADRALRDLADAPAPGARRAAPALRWLAVTLDVCRRTGAPVAAALDGLAAALEAEEAAAADRAAALAGPRATAVVLAVLPLGGVALGLLVGADPLGTLLGTGPGRGCLVAGGGAWVAGAWWTRRLVHRAVRAGEVAW